MFKWKTRWDKLTLFARLFTIGYVLAILITQPKWHSGWGWNWPDWLRDITSAGLAVALMILSIGFGGVLTNFYDKLTGFGISEVRVDRKGADPMLTNLWMERIRGSEEVIIVGTLSQGWFVVAHANLQELLQTSKQPRSIRVCLLDPFGKVWRSKIESGQSVHENFLRDATQVFRNLSDLMEKFQDRVQVQLYDTEPLSCVIARGAIYLGLYLPGTERKEIPEFTISGGSFLGDKVYAESIKKLRSSAPSVIADGLSKYITTMEKHFTTTREAFWSDPHVYCDFCKELRGLPSEFSRRFPTFAGGTRITEAKKNFFLVPSLGQMVSDHTLIVSKQHVTSSAQLSADALHELAEILDRLQAGAEPKTRSHLFFEHGVPLEGTSFGGCGICHCHVHSLPVQNVEYAPLEDIEAFLKRKNCKFTKHVLGSWEEISKSAGSSYLCVQAGKAPPVIFVFALGQRVESQLMRQFLAENCPNAKKQWDWRSGVEDPGELQNTCNQLNETFSESAVPSTKTG